MASVTFQETKTTTADASEYTFSGANIGTAAADRYVIAGISVVKANSADDFTGITVTIGGVSASTSSFIQVGGQRPVTLIAVANVPTGTTADVVVTMPNTARDGLCAVWTTNGISTTPTDTGTSSAPDPTSDIDVLAGGIIVGVALSTSVTTSVSWTGLTENYDTAFGSGPDTHSGACVDSASATTITCTANFADNTGTEVGSFASFPAVAAGPANLKSYNTNPKANIKSINTNLIANVKSLNTNV